MQPDGTVLINTKINTDGTKTGSEDIKRTLSGTMDYIKLLPQAFRDIPSIMKHTFSSASRSVKSLAPNIRNLQDEVDRYKDALYYAEKAGYGLGDAPYDKAYAGLQRAKKAMQDYKKNLLGVDNGQKKASKSGSRFNKTLKGTEKSSRGARMGLGRMLATSILFSAVFRTISAVTGGLKEGMDNLAQYSDDTNKALSTLMSGMTQLKNSFGTAFSPLVEYVSPALAQFINLLSQAVTWTAQLLAALTGKDTFVKAVKVQQDYADSLDKTKDETKDAAKETEKAIAPFDKLIQITTGKKKTTDKNQLKPEDMFTTEEVSNDIKL